MCGRYGSVAERTRIAEFYTAEAIGAELEPNYNTAPTDPVNVVVERSEDKQPRRQIRTMRWGLVPSWSKDLSSSARMINARVETVDTKPAYRQAFARRRAILPATGYIGWQPEQVDGKIVKQPYYLHPTVDDGILSFAGLYELWRQPDKADDDPDRWLWSVTIITTAARGPAGEIHDRTPLLLPHDRIDRWLGPALTDIDQVRSILTDVPLEPLEIRPVSRAINSVKNNGPGLLAPLPERRDELLQLVFA